MDGKSLETEGRKIMGVPPPAPGRPRKERKPQEDRIVAAVEKKLGGDCLGMREILDSDGTTVDAAQSNVTAVDVDGEETKEERKKAKASAGGGKIAVEDKAKVAAEAAEKKRLAAEEKERKRLDKAEKGRIAVEDKAKAATEAAEKKRLAAEEKERKRLDKAEKGLIAVEDKAKAAEKKRLEKEILRRIAAEEKQATAEIAEAERMTDIAKQRHIPGMKYRKGPDKTLRKAPHNESESQSEWWLDPKAAYPPASCRGFTDKTLTMLPSLVVPAEGGQSVIRWGNPSADYTMMEWEEMVADWQERFPNIKDKDKGGTRHETRSKSEEPDTMKTTAPITIRACWALLPSCRPSKYSGAVGNLLDHFKVDMWNNVICLPKKLPEGRASDSSLTSFDVDHLFPFSRGGRSVRSNFAACQSFANRQIKVDNLIQCLDPVAMNCGLMYPQLLAMCDAVLEEVHDKRNTTQNRCDAILYWLTSAQENGDKFNQNFQTAVKRSLDGRTLIHFFESHFARDKEVVISGGGAQERTIVTEVAGSEEIHVQEAGEAGGNGGAEQVAVGNEGKMKNKKKKMLRTDKCAIA